MPYTGYAQDGARAADVVARQVPAFAAQAPAEAHYDVGCLYIGVNDVRAVDFDADGFARDVRSILALLGQRCDRVLTALIPRDLGRPRAGHLEEGNEILLAAAREAHALLLDLRDFGARNLVMADHVHPTAFGQIAIAERALAVLGADGLPTQAPPRSLVSWEATRLGRLRGDATYAYRHAKVSARAAYLSARAAAGRPSGSTASSG